MYVAEELPRFGIGLVDSVAFVASYTPDQKTNAVLRVESERSEIYRWAREEYVNQREKVA